MMEVSERLLSPIRMFLARNRASPIKPINMCDVGWETEVSRQQSVCDRDLCHVLEVFEFGL